MNAQGLAVPDGTGMRQIVVGTGGEDLGNNFSATPLPASQVRDGVTFGIASVTLGVGTYSWASFFSWGTSGVSSGGVRMAR